MKWILILVLVVVIMLIAKGVSQQIVDKHDFYYNLKEFLNKFKLNVSFKQEKLNEFLGEIKPKKYFKVFIDEYKKFVVSGKINLDNIKILEESEKIELTEAIKGIGILDSKGEINQINGILLNVEEKLTKTQQDKQKLAPLIIKLSFLFALGLAILLI